jgi:hypothetical protein
MCDVDVEVSDLMDVKCARPPASSNKDPRFILGGIFECIK